MSNPSFAVYRTLRLICLFHGLKVQDVSRRTLYNWKINGVSYDTIDLLRLRLLYSGKLSSEAFDDLCLSCSYEFQ